MAPNSIAALLVLLAVIARPALAQIRFTGMCDASGAVWTGSRLLVINDEDQDTTLLRLFNPEAPGAALSSAALPTATLQFDPKEPEIDLEAVTPAGGGRYWAIGSHSRNTNGLARWSRQNLISFRWGTAGPADVRAITTLLPALAIQARQADKDLKNLDSPQDPKDGGLSIEGLAATPAGDLLIGVRSPLDTKNRALVARLSKPDAVLASNRALPNLDKMFQLALNGGGVRDIIYDAPAKRFLILSGPVGSGGPFQIWTWTGDDKAPKMLKDVTSLIPAGTAPEGLVRTLDGTAFWLVLDEGGREDSDGKCKDLPPAKQSFRMIRTGL